MNQTLSFLQKNGLKVSLPLLLLATGCGEGAGSSFRADAGPATTPDTPAAVTPTTDGFAAPTADGTGLATPTVPPVGSTEGISGPVLPSSNRSNGGTPAGITLGSGSPSASVPEPAALAGLAIAAAGMVVIKRKQSA